MVKIDLDSTWRIESDTNNWILSKRASNRCVHTYFFTSLSSLLQSLLQSYLDMKLRLSNVETVNDLLTYQKNLLLSLNKALQPFKFEVISKND